MPGPTSFRCPLGLTYFRLAVPGRPVAPAPCRRLERALSGGMVGVNLGVIAVSYDDARWPTPRHAL